jgi:hypothetical protein
MLAVAYLPLTWIVIASGVLAALWIILRRWAPRRSAQVQAMRSLLTDGSLSPRGQHYYFAHAALKALAFEDPERLVIALAAPGADQFLVEMWHAVGKDAIAQTGDAKDGNLPADGLESIPARVAGRPTALVRLPTPVASTEAYFVAIVLNHELEEPKKPDPEPQVYYFTLEKGFALDGSTRTVFAQWDETSHRNFGDGPAPQPRALLDFIANHLGAAPRIPQASFQPGSPGKQDLTPPSSN